MRPIARAVVASIFAIFGTGISSDPAASAYPDKLIRLIVSFPPGGSSDSIARIVQPGLEKELGQSVLVENRPGAGGIIAIDAIAKAEPDGYLIGLGGAG